MDDYEIDDEPCPKCDSDYTHARRCNVLGCDDGWIDLYEEEPMFYYEGDREMCSECHGTGQQRWCPKCGHDMNAPVSGPLPVSQPGDGDGAG
jgi:hypothetical protein